VAWWEKAPGVPTLRGFLFGQPILAVVVLPMAGPALVAGGNRERRVGRQEVGRVDPLLVDQGEPRRRSVRGAAARSESDENDQKDRPQGTSLIGFRTSRSPPSLHFPLLLPHILLTGLPVAGPAFRIVLVSVAPEARAGVKAPVDLVQDDVIPPVLKDPVGTVPHLRARLHFLVPDMACLAERRGVACRTEVLPLLGVHRVLPDEHDGMAERRVRLERSGGDVLVALPAVGPMRGQFLRVLRRDRRRIGQDGAAEGEGKSDRREQKHRRRSPRRRTRKKKPLLLVRARTTGSGLHVHRPPVRSSEWTARPGVASTGRSSE